MKVMVWYFVSDTTRSWLHWFLFYFILFIYTSWFGWNCQTVYVQSIILEFSLQFLRYFGSFPSSSFLDFVFLGFSFSLCLPFFLDSLVYSILFMLSWASQQHDQVVPLLPVLWCSSLCWLIFDNGLDWLLVGDDVQGMDVTIAGHYHKCCYWQSLNLHVPVTSVQAAAQFFLCFLILESPFFLVWWYFSGSKSYINVLSGYLSIALRSM